MLKRVSNSFGDGGSRKSRSDKATVVAAPLREYCLMADQTMYIPTAFDLKRFLEATFQREYKNSDIRVGSSIRPLLCFAVCAMADLFQEISGRWVYFAPRELEEEEVRLVASSSLRSNSVEAW